MYLSFIVTFISAIFLDTHAVLQKANYEMAPLLVLNNAKQAYNPETKILLFEDKTGHLSFEQIKDSISKFKIIETKTISLGTTTSAIWCIVRVKNIAGGSWFFDIGEPYVDHIDVYSFNKAGDIVHNKTGFIRNYYNRLMKVNCNLLPMNIALGEEKVFFIRAQSATILKLPVTIATLQRHYELNHRKDFIFGLYFGLVMALSIYNFFVFISIRDITYLYYVFYINSLGATVAWLKGYAPEFLNFLPPHINHGNNYASLAFIFLMLFTTSLLNTNKINSRLKWIGITLLIFNVISLLSNILGYYRIGFYFILTWIFLCFPYVIFSGFYALKKKIQPARFYLLGFSLFALGDLVYILNENGVLPQGFVTQYSLPIGSSLEAIILSFALADKLNSYKKEKEESQKMALAQSSLFSKKLIETQETERKRIAGELHDSIGQSLSLIKNRITLLKKGMDKQDSLNELNDVVTNTIQEVRSISYGLRPFQLDILGLTQSIKSLIEDVADSSDIDYAVNIENIDGLFSKESEINIFRIIQECLNNISKHSRATQASIKVNRLLGKVEISIEDNGVGIPVINGASGMGLIGIKERVNILDGKLYLKDKSPQGTVVTIILGSPVMVV